MDDLGRALSAVCILVDLHGCGRRLIYYLPDNEGHLIILSIVSQYRTHSSIYPSALHGYVFLYLLVPV